MQKTWWKEAVIYQIYPRSFKDGNGDGIGDLKGIIEKLDYIKDLGIDVIWLSPIYKSPNADNGYDISDYRDIMDEFGTMEDFDTLLSEAHKRSLKIVMDLVVNHSSDEHKWFMESKKSKSNPYRDYYIWKEGKDGKAPNNWISCFGGSAWEYDETTDMYYLHIFAKKQPDLNWDNPRVREEVFEMMRFWCDKGIDGFRMDVINLISKKPDFPDGPLKKGSIYGDFTPHAVNGPNVHAYIKEMNEKVLSRYDLLTVGETSGVSTKEALQYAGFDSHELNMVFNFEHVDIGNVDNKWSSDPLDLVAFKKIFTRWQTDLYNKAWNSIYIENHDQPRSVSRFGNDSKEYRKYSAKMLATCMYLLQGTPYIYQGQEIGMTNYPFTSKEEFVDIESITAYKQLVIDDKQKTHDEMMKALKLKSRDNARTPMQWAACEYAGFSSTKPWIFVNPNYVDINVEESIKDEDSILNYYKKLLRLRKSSDTIIYGSYEVLDIENPDTYTYIRKLDKEEILVMANFTNTDSPTQIPKGFEKGEVFISNYDRKELSAGMVLKPYEAIAIRKENL